MRPSRFRVALLVGSLLLPLSRRATACAQAADTVHRYTLFGGTTTTSNFTWHHPGNAEIGGSVDFRLGDFPLPLRASLAFGQEEQQIGTHLQFGSLSLDAIARPVPTVFGTQLYLLGGLGLGTRGGYGHQAGGSYSIPGIPQAQYTYFGDGQKTWSFVEGGAGLERGRLFMQMKMQAPVASDGYVRVPIGFGWRF